ncbi:unnamed protein product, partial [Discosporangium mesarthrocarpum]
MWIGPEQKLDKVHRMVAKKYEASQIQGLWSLGLQSLGLQRHCKLEEDIEAWEACVVYYRRPKKGGGRGGGLSGSGSGAGVGSGARWLAMGEDDGPGANASFQGRTFQEEPAAPRLLRLVLGWVKERARARAGAGAGLGGEAEM